MQSVFFVGKRFQARKGFGIGILTQIWTGEAEKSGERRRNQFMIWNELGLWLISCSYPTELNNSYERRETCGNELFRFNSPRATIESRIESPVISGASFFFVSGTFWYESVWLSTASACGRKMISLSSRQMVSLHQDESICHKSGSLPF